LLPLSYAQGGSKAGASSTHSKRFATFDCPFAVLRFDLANALGHARGWMKAGASSTHSKRFATFDCLPAMLRLELVSALDSSEFELQPFFGLRISAFGFSSPCFRA
jgi:hypothetical protein